MSNWYDNPVVVAEIATVANDITFLELIDTPGTFFIPSLTPTLDNTIAADVTTRQPSTKSQSNTNLDVMNYKSSNAVTLYIPKYLLYNFFDFAAYMEQLVLYVTKKTNKEPTIQGVIPAGTQFIITSFGVDAKIEHIRIIGLATYEEVPQDEQSTPTGRRAYL